MNTVRTRIAPSPTGQDLHIGNAYTALINYILAKKYNGQFIIRIEDTDRTRFIEGSEEHILASLAWLGITHAEGPDIGGPYAPYKQSERLPLYKTYAEQLIQQGHAYYCFCTSQRLQSMREQQEHEHKPPMYDGLCKTISGDEAKKRVDAGEEHVIRLNVPDTGTTTFTDSIRGEISFENKLIDDQVLLKSDGYPTYHLGVVVDDHEMHISHIIRGEEWISSTPKHILLYQSFGWELPTFAHMPVLRNPDKSKLSKRKNPVWVTNYKEQGFLPEAICNYLTLMAWSHPDGKELYSIDDMIHVFELSQIQTTAPVFDTDKLRWMNGEYLRQTANEKLVQLLKDFYPDQSFDEEMLKKSIPLIKERMKILSEYMSLAGFFYHAPKEFEKEVDQDLCKELYQSLYDLTDWSHDSMEQTIRSLATKIDKKPKDVFMMLRIAVTGKTVGPPLLESLELLGKEETLKRLG